jgi:hypothetical protein
MDAWDIAALRFGVAGLLLSPVLVRRGLARDRLGWRGLTVIVAGLGAPYALVAAGGMRFAPASDQGALNPGCMPLFVALIAAVILGEKLSTTRKLGLSLILAGAVVIIAWARSSLERRLGRLAQFWRCALPRCSIFVSVLHRGHAEGKPRSTSWGSTGLRRIAGDLSTHLRCAVRNPACAATARRIYSSGDVPGHSCDHCFPSPMAARLPSLALRAEPLLGLWCRRCRHRWQYRSLGNGQKRQIGSASS